jgi:hypothetical protein
MSFTACSGKVSHKRLNILKETEPKQNIGMKEINCHKTVEMSCLDCLTWM